MFSDSAKKFIQEHQNDDVKKLALQSSLLAKLGADVNFVLRQIEGRQITKNKIPSWFGKEDIIYPSHLSLEQSSSELTARYKASLLSGNSFVDLTGGFGVDCAFVSGNFEKATYVEKNTDLCNLASHNFKVLQLQHIEVENTDSVEYLKKLLQADCIFIDPARRSISGRKVVFIEDCEPDLVGIQDLLLEKAGTVLVKLSPMLDITQALNTLKSVFEVHVVSVENECKELLFLVKRGFIGEPSIVCVNLCKNKQQVPISFLYSEEKKVAFSPVSYIGNYLYEPNASILKAGFFKGIASKYSLNKLHKDSHLYTSDNYIPDFPGRGFQVEAYSSMNKKELKSLLLDIDKAHISVRNFPLSVVDLRKKLKIKEGGEIYLFATSLEDHKHILIKTRKITSDL